MRFWICLIWLGFSTVQGLADFPRGEYSVTQIRSSIDGTDQACGVFIPKKEGERPVLVFLHSWSWGLEQDNTRWLNLAKERDWIYLQPDFRGKNLRPELSVLS